MGRIGAAGGAVEQCGGCSNSSSRELGGLGCESSGCGPGFLKQEDKDETRGADESARCKDRK